MSDMNAKVKAARDLIDEYLRGEREVDRNEREIDRLIAKLDEVDAATTALVGRQRAITDELAPLLADGRILRVFLRGEPFAVSHGAGDWFLGVAPLHTIDSAVVDAHETIRLPGRQAAIYHGVAVVDQEAG